MLKNQIWVWCLFLACMSAYAQQLSLVELGIDGLTCSQCMRSVEVALRKQVGVETVRVDLQATIAYVEVNDEVQLPLLKRAVEQAGFSVRSMALVFSAPMSIASCMKWGGGCLFWQSGGKDTEPLKKVYVAGASILSKRAYKQWYRTHRLPPQVACAECLTNVWYVSKIPYDEATTE